MKTIRQVNTLEEYKIAIARIEELINLNPKLESVEYEELDYIGTLVSNYEEIYFPINAIKKQVLMWGLFSTSNNDFI